MRAHHRNQTFRGSTTAIATRDVFDARVQDAVARLRRNLKSPPHPAWRFADVAAGRYNPLRVAAEMIDGAIEKGATEDDAYAMVTVLADHIARRFPVTVLPVREAVRLESARNGPANDAQVRVACEPESVSALVEAEEHTARDVRGAQLLLDSIRATLRRLRSGGGEMRIAR